MAYGSRSVEESAERMRRAGFTDWEIAAELKLRKEAERDLEANTARIREPATGPLEARADASGFREEEARLSLTPAPRMDFAAEADRLSRAINDAYDFGDFASAKATEERLAALLALEADLGARGRQAPAPEGARSAEKAAEAQPRPRGVSVSVPKEVSGRDAVRMWTNPRNGKEMAEVTLPPHASVGGKDASFHRFSVESRFLKAFGNDPGYYHVLFPKTSRDGSPWTVTLQKKEGHWERPGAPKGERGAWIVDAASSLKVSSASLAEAMDGFREERRAWAAAQPREDAPALDARRAEDAPATIGQREAARKQEERPASLPAGFVGLSALISAEASALPPDFAFPSPTAALRDIGLTYEERTSALRIAALREIADRGFEAVDEGFARGLLERVVDSEHSRLVSAREHAAGDLGQAVKESLTDHLGADLMARSDKVLDYAAEAGVPNPVAMSAPALAEVEAHGLADAMARRFNAPAPAAPAPDAAKQGAGGIGNAARNARAASGKQGRERWVETAAPARRQDDGAPTPAEDARAFRAQAASLASAPPRAERAIR